MAMLNNQMVIDTMLYTYSHIYTHTYIYVHMFYEISITDFWCWEGVSDIPYPGFSGDDSLPAVLDPVPGAWRSRFEDCTVSV